MSNRKRQGRVRRTERIRKRKKTISSVILLMVLLVAIMASLLFIPFFNVSSVSCSGTKILSEDAVIDASGVVPGINIFRISVHKIEENIERALPYVADVTVQRLFPSSVHLEVVERTPVAYVQNGASYLVIDGEGIVLEVTDSLDTCGVLPLLSGLQPEEKETITLGKTLAVSDQYRFKKLLYCVNLIQQKKDLNGRVTALCINDLMQYELMVEDRISAVIPVDSDIDYQLDFMLAALAQQSATIEGEIDLTIEGKAAFRPKIQEMIVMPDSEDKEETKPDVQE